MLNERLPRLKKGGLYLITQAQSSSARLYEKVEQSLSAGAGLLQYRDKSTDSAKRLREAGELKRLCQHYQVPFLINDDVNLAQSIRADGVHLGQDDMNLKEARQTLGQQAIIGVSCYGQITLAQAAMQQGADYVAFGRFYPSSSKPEAKPAPLSVLREARAKLDCPIVAIGGILPTHVTELQQAGANWCAVIGGVFNAANTRLATQSYLTDVT